MANNRGKTMSLIKRGDNKKRDVIMPMLSKTRVGHNDSSLFDFTYITKMTWA